MLPLLHGGVCSVGRRVLVLTKLPHRAGHTLLRLLSLSGLLSLLSQRSLHDPLLPLLLLIPHGCGCGCGR